MESLKTKFVVAKPIKRSDLPCPLCGGEVYYIEILSGEAEVDHKSHIWGCNDCPMVMLEFYTERDTQALDYLLNSPR